jgi:hypothetical protein
METLSSMATAASNTIWGNGEAKSNEEPVSGQQGAGTVNEPYDKGNEEPQSGLNGSAKSATTNGPSDAVSSEETGNPTSGQQPAQKQQGADRPDEEPKNDIKDKMPHTDEEREKMVESGNFPHDPNDHSGEPLKVHDGGAKQSENTEGTEGKKDRSASVAHEGGDPHGEPKKGMGTEYVKSSGMKADGGDFDASNPGAGAEANRLLEESGVHKTKDAPKDADDDTSAQSQQTGQSGEEKVSKIQKIKEKLHIGKSS